MKDNPEAPHRAVIWLHADVYELLNTGECSGKTVHNLKRQPFFVDGKNKEQAVEKLNKLIKGFQDETDNL